MDNDFIKAEVSKIFDETVKIRRDIHMNPELGFEETETSQKIKNILTECGVEIQSAAGTGIVGILENGDGIVAASRADIDPFLKKMKWSISPEQPVKCMHAVMMFIRRYSLAL